MDHLIVIHRTGKGHDDQHTPVVDPDSVQLELFQLLEAAHRYKRVANDDSWSDEERELARRRAECCIEVMCKLLRQPCVGTAV